MIEIVTKAFFLQRPHWDNISCVVGNFKNIHGTASTNTPTQKNILWITQGFFPCGIWTYYTLRSIKLRDDCLNHSVKRADQYLLSIISCHVHPQQNINRCKDNDILCVYYICVLILTNLLKLESFCVCLFVY